MPRRGLTTSDIRRLLVELAERLAGRGLATRVYVVGGAALALTVFGDHERRSTLDVDASFRKDAALLEELEAMALEHGLDDEWCNNDAKLGFPPNGFPAGSLLVESGAVQVVLAPPDLLLAMKLRAARWGRDEEDIGVLVRACDVRTDAEAKAVLDHYYLGEERLKADALDMLAVTRGAFTVSTARPPIYLPPIAERPTTVDRSSRS